MKNESDEPLFPDPSYSSTNVKRTRRSFNHGSGIDNMSLTSVQEIGDGERHEKYLLSQRQLMQLRRTADEDRGKSDLRIMQLERELSLERKRYA